MFILPTMSSYVIIMRNELKIEPFWLLLEIYINLAKVLKALQVELVGNKA